MLIFGQSNAAVAHARAGKWSGQSSYSLKRRIKVIYRTSLAFFKRNTYNTSIENERHSVSRPEQAILLWFSIALVASFALMWYTFVEIEAFEVFLTEEEVPESLQLLDMIFHPLGLFTE